jgi:hypothetical protein
MSRKKQDLHPMIMRVPPDVRAWLEARKAETYNTMVDEAIRCIRAEMAREKRAARKAA